MNTYRHELQQHYTMEMVKALKETPSKPHNHLSMGRFIAACAPGVTFIPTGVHTGDWYVWDGKVHALTDLDIDETLVTAFVDALRVMALTSDDHKRVEGISSDSGLSALKRRVRSELKKPRNHFDRNRNWLVMSNGYVLDTSDLSAAPLPPSMDRPVTRRLGVSIDMDNLGSVSAGTQWQAWLNQVLPDRDEQRYLQETAGAALLGGGDAKHIVHLVGPKNTGKSTYLRIMADVFGSRKNNGYSGRLPASALVKNYGGGANFAQSAAKGTRFLFLSEPTTDRTDDSFMKNLAGGGEPITTERKGLDSEEWLAECVLHIAANSVVRFDTRDKALSDRIDIVEFTHVIESVNTRFVEELIEQEGDAILLWIIAGARRYEMSRGRIDVPESIKERAKRHVVDASAPQRWLQEAQLDRLVQVDTSAPARTFITRGAAFKMFQDWCFENGEKPISQKWWLNDIHSALDAPSDFAQSRPGGARRVYGVVPVSDRDRQMWERENQEYLDFLGQ